MAFLNEFKLNQRSLLSNLIAGGVVGIFEVFVSISFGSVIFSGELTESLPLGIGLLLFSFFVVTAISASFSSYPAIVATPQDTTIPVLALVAAHIADKLPSDISAGRVDTVVAMLILNSLVVALLFFSLGQFKLGGLIRFIPYPVVGGFLAGMGVLLIKSAFHSLPGIDYHSLEFFSLFHLNALLQWLPGLLVALALFLASRYLRQSWVMPIVLISAIGLFYLSLTITGTSIATAKTQGLLFGDFPQGNLYEFTTPQALTHANWAVIFQQLPDLIALWIIDIIALLFSASGIELVASRDLDLNYELKVAGLASLGAGLGGGVSGFPVLGETSLAHHLGGDRRLVGWTISGLCLATLVMGPTLIPFVPRFLVIGFPILLGLELVYEWLYRAWFRLPKIDFAIIVLIVWVIASVGYLEGIGVGLVAAVALFVLNLSRVNVVKHELSGTDHHSHVVRSPQQQQFLQKKGEQIQMLELQGFIFFGTANHLLDRIKLWLNTQDRSFKFLLIDFRQVIGLDSSAVLSFAKLKQLASQHDFHLVLTSLKPTMQKVLQRGVPNQADPGFQTFPDLDRGLEWCEVQILESTTWRRSRYVPLPMQLKNLFQDGKQVNVFMPYLEKQQIAADAILFQQAESPDAVYFVESGQISTFLTSETGQSRRLRTLGAGTVVGEIAFFTRSPYQATAIADQSSTLYRLSTKSMQTMIQEKPQTAAIFQEYMLFHLASRLVQSNEEIRKLLR